MRVGVRSFCAAVFSIVVLSGAVRADELDQNVFVSKIPGFALFVFSTGDEKPCDWLESKLQNDVEFVLNTASIDFVQFDKTDSSRHSWPYLLVSARSLKTSRSCVWTLEVKVMAPQTGANIYGQSYRGTIQIWHGDTFGISPGDGLTAYVSDAAQDILKELVNDIHASRKKYAQ